jgi:iron(III) transport system ATP-binding protein
MIAGFEEPTSGEIRFGERLMNEVPPNRRDAAMVFQSYAIFPHLDVEENVAFGLKLKSLPRADVAARVGRVLEQTGLAGMARRSPSQLSGGQQQRVALARAIVMEPRVLLFDEPLSNLDAKLRDQMRVEIRELQQRLGITSLYVTHDQVEAMSISDRIVVMNAGVVEQVGTPREIYVRPASRFVAGFIGKVNFVPATALGAGRLAIAGREVGPLPVVDGRPGDTLTLAVRPEEIALAREGGDLRGTVRRVIFLGSTAEYLVEVPGLGPWLVDQANPGERCDFAPGDEIGLTLSRTGLHSLPREEGPAPDEAAER